MSQPEVFSAASSKARKEGKSPEEKYQLAHGARKECLSSTYALSIFRFYLSIVQPKKKCKPWLVYIGASSSGGFWTTVPRAASWSRAGWDVSNWSLVWSEVWTIQSKMDATYFGVSHSLLLCCAAQFSSLAWRGVDLESILEAPAVPFQSNWKSASLQFAFHWGFLNVGLITHQLVAHACSSEVFIISAEGQRQWASKTSLQCNAIAPQIGHTWPERKR